MCTITHSHPNRGKRALDIIPYTSDVLPCLRETKYVAGGDTNGECVCGTSLFVLCVCVFEREKRGRNHTPEVIVCVTTGQNLIARLLSR